MAHCMYSNTTVAGSVMMHQPLGIDYHNQYSWPTQISATADVVSGSAQTFMGDVDMSFESLFDQPGTVSPHFGPSHSTQTGSPIAIPQRSDTPTNPYNGNFAESLAPSPTSSYSPSISGSSFADPSSIESRSSTMSSCQFSDPFSPVIVSPSNDFHVFSTASFPGHALQPNLIYPNLATNYPESNGHEYDQKLDAFLRQIDPLGAECANTNTAMSQGTESTNLAAVFRRPSDLALRALLDEILASPWYKTHQLEPMKEKGKSVLIAFLEHEGTGGAYRCLFDTCTKRLDRQDRALGHIRMHLAHRPFVCNSQCGVPDCQERFFCRSYLRSHMNRKKERCDRCQQDFFPQFLRKHRATCQGIQNEAAYLPPYSLLPAYTNFMHPLNNAGHGPMI